MTEARIDRHGQGPKTLLTFSEENYRRAFITENLVMYPSIDAYERSCGFALDKTKLLNAARVLACPVKANPPNWQHGRVLYSTLCKFLTNQDTPWFILDVGTAKGFSALCMLWALQYTGFTQDNWEIHSLDVIDPNARIRRNTVAETTGLLTLYETLEHWKESSLIQFHGINSLEWLKQNSKRRINFAFLDGKHKYEVVAQELDMLSKLQKPGDMIVMDDLQVPGVLEAAQKASGLYHIEQLQASGRRVYGIATRR